MPLVFFALSLLPFALFCLLLIFHHRSSLLRVSLYTLLLTLLLVLFFWHLPSTLLFQSVTKGTLIAVDIFFIIFGAIFFLEILRQLNIVNSLACHLESFSRDLRVKTIVLAWFLGNFLEGIAGFGTSLTVVSPLLTALGLTPFTAAVISLLGNSTSVPFGAVGTPIRAGYASIDLNLNTIAVVTAKINLIGFIVPIFMLWILIAKQSNRNRLFLQALPFAIWSGIAFVLPSYLISLFGLEFPSIIGSVIGLGLILTAKKFGIFVPKTIYRSSSPNSNRQNPLPLTRTLFPYCLFIFLLIVGKIVFSHSVPIPFVDYSFSLFNPGFVFIITSLIIILIFRPNPASVNQSCRHAFNRSLEPFLVISAMSVMVQLMNNSANPNLNLLSITRSISQAFNTSLLPYLAPFIGAFGSFITGSATVSNLMFGSSLFASSLAQHFNPQTILSLSLVGAGAGNMIAIADVYIALSIVGIKKDLRPVLLFLLSYCLVYLILAGLIGLFIV